MKKIEDIVERYISGDWGSEYHSDETPFQVNCIRGADINAINMCEGAKIPLRYIGKTSFKNKLLNEGNIVIEKSGGSPTQSTGRVAYISERIKNNLEHIVCSNFCSAFEIKSDWNAKYVFYYLQNVYNSGVFFNFEGKTSGIKNLLLEQAFKSIPIKDIPFSNQEKIVKALSFLDSKIELNNRINDNLPN